MFEYFPGNYTWNMAVNLCLGMGGQIGEIDSVSGAAREASNRGDPAASEKLFTAWSSLGERLTRLAREDERKGHSYSAGMKYRRATIYYLQAERMQAPDFEPRKQAYQKVLECFEKYLQLTGQKCERVEVPYKDTFLPALFVPAANDRDAQTPCMIHFDGLDVTKEILYLVGMGPELSRRGVSALLVDNPGVGESLRRRGLKNFPEAEVPAAACVDYLESRPDVDPRRIGIMALSLGGYHAPRAAAFEPRLACCVAWGANYNWGATQRYRYESRDRSLPVPHYWNHAMWVFGSQSVEDLLETADRMTLAGVLHRIRCPILIEHGGNDRQIKLEQAQQTFDDCVNSVKRELKIHSIDDGGAEHCSIDNISLGVDSIADWVGETMRELGAQR
ncbi:alpha/beta hydrolase family protein [Paraburkholderia megapolitana]|uniref:Prolyl oligopeptidase family protein n=1 Tax=Paraburkholderia megapolitana TaxID=420953 RepID=A0A1I3QJR2_9BURK|nr:alpha/beta fold hydrolase [Paraburkholderia megapolitana]QDQ81281.1 prolyl oligopeptidase family serine peptidase [Paraburkholderia megapolitana]SFJ34364.1 Prolyl oligopeptidase family protein [Paraburkholderia megapolitana]